MSAANAIDLTIAVSGGQLQPTGYQQHVIDCYLQTREGRDVVLKLSRPTNRRSLNQNRFYWGTVLAIIAADTGHTPEEIHHALKAILLPRKFITLKGREVEIAKTTTDLSTEEFEAYLERVRAWASTELGIEIPTPE